MNHTIFPGPDTLCEDCGYALKGLRPEGSCPECGQAIARSSPDLRSEPTKRSRVWIDLVRRPKAYFRALRVDGSNAPARWFMLKTVLLIGLFWLLWGILGGPGSPEDELFKAGVVVVSIYLLSYIEVLGVTYFSRRRDWRVPFRLAERLVCYACIGWIPAAIVMGLALDRYLAGDIDRWMRRLLGTWGAWQSLELLILIGCIALMGFELLVWTGVRQTKHANFQADPTALGVEPGECALPVET